MHPETNDMTGAIIWLTGLSGAGKSTLATTASAHVRTMGLATTVIDGDVLRHTICRDLGFSAADRCENIRRAGEAALTQAQQGNVVFVALISPIESARRKVEARCAEENVPFALVYVDASLACCERRDPKGLYHRAREGQIGEFTGISSPYEAPIAPALVVRTDQEAKELCVERVVQLAMSVVQRDPSCWVRL